MQNRFQRVSIETRYSNYRHLANQGQADALSSVLLIYDVTVILFAGCHQTEENDQRAKPTGDGCGKSLELLSIEQQVVNTCIRVILDESSC